MAQWPANGATDWNTKMKAFLDVSTDTSTGKILDGAEQQTSAAPSADAALANKKYVDDGGERPVNGSATVVHTKYFTGTTGAVNLTVAHGVSSIDKILHCSAAIKRSGTTYFAGESFNSAAAADQWTLTWDGTNVQLGDLGSNMTTQKYVIKIDYID